MTTLTAHPLAALIPSMMADELVDLERDIAKNGQQQPIVIYEGQILDGRHRYAVCQKLGIPPQSTTFAGTAAEAKALVLSLNVHRRHLTFEQKTKLVEAELQRDPAQSDRAIAELAKVSPTTVGKVRAEAEAAGKVSTVDTITGKDGVKQPRKRSLVPPMVRSSPLGSNSTQPGERSRESVQAKPGIPSRGTPPAIGVPLARAAVQRLGEIAADDTERAKAWALVAKWLVDNAAAADASDLCTTAANVVEVLQRRPGVRFKNYNYITNWREYLESKAKALRGEECRRVSTPSRGHGVEGEPASAGTPGGAT